VNALLLLAVQNTLLALVLAFVVYGVTRVRRIPPLAHLLWLLVLLKLVAPPVLPIDSSRLLPPRTKQVDQQIADTSRNVPQTARHQQQPLIAEPGAIAPHERSRGSVKVPSDRTAHEPVESALEGKLTGRLAWISDRAVWDGALIFIFWCWLSGAVFFSLVAGTRILRFEHTLKHTMPAPGRLQRLARDIAGKLNVRRIPNVRFVESVEVPMLWWAGRRATIVLPTKLFQQLDDSEAALILAHELAHLRRRDHWVRAIEMLVSIVYWWNPLVWAIRRQIHRAEDLCCDAWVRWAFPDCTKRYAEVVLKAAELLNSPGVAPRLLPASPFLGSDSLKARIEMILQSRFAPGVSRRSLFIVGLLALVIWPSFLSGTRTEAQPVSKADVPVAPAPEPSKPDRPPGSEFPYTVRFEQGATRFLAGDKITIVEIRGTAASFTPGNIYWIKGTYTLGSCDRAILLASTTVDSMDFLAMQTYDPSMQTDCVFPGHAKGQVPGYATGLELQVQRADVKRGTGTFTLFLPMKHRGWPHVNFCAVEHGKGFGATYFGTPDSVTGNTVLKKWWDSNDGQAADDATFRQVGPPMPLLVGASPQEAKRIAGRLESLGFKVKFEPGPTSPDPSQNWHIASQDPPATAPLQSGKTIVLRYYIVQTANQVP
jgi:beta-lactamase regulating signal transducer with metallopeptidase domain